MIPRHRNHCFPTGISRTYPVNETSERIARILISLQCGFQRFLTVVGNEIRQCPNGNRIDGDTIRNMVRRMISSRTASR